MIGKEASNGSKIQIVMNASFFELTKVKFIAEIQEYDVITKIENCLRVKVSSESQGDGFVEFSVKIGFQVKEHVHYVKLTAYPTTCPIMLQTLGEKHEIKSHLGMILLMEKLSLKV